MCRLVAFLVLLQAFVERPDSSLVVHSRQIDNSRKFSYKIRTSRAKGPQNKLRNLPSLGVPALRTLLQMLSNRYCRSIVALSVACYKNVNGDVLP